MKKGESIVEIITRHQVYLERLKTGIANDFAAVLTVIEKEVRALILARDVDSISQLHKAQLNKLIADTRKVQVKLHKKAQKDFFNVLHGVMDYEVGFESAALATATNVGLLPLGKIKTPKAAEAYSYALNRPIAATGELLEPFVSGWRSKQVSSVENLLRQAWVNGLTTQQTVRAMRGTKANNYSDGLINGISRRQAHAVARTATQHVSSAAKAKLYEENPNLVIKERFISVLDSRTSPQCRALSGKEFPRGEGPIPPLHINCRSNRVPVLNDEYAFLTEDEQQSSMHGYVDGKMTYYEWLKTQDVDFQIDVLGKERAQLFQKGGISAQKFADMQLDKSFRPLSLKEMKSRNSLIFKRAGLDEI